MVCEDHNVCAVILVGGKGKRLRPLSSASRPKSFLSVTSDKKTMFRRTLDRIRKVIPDGNIIVVANKAHARLVKADFPGIKKENFILEPVSRNTAPAIALAALTIQKNYGDAVMAVLPTDHYIIKEAKYISALKDAVCFIRSKGDAIVVMGVKAGNPAVDLGYVKIKPQEILIQNVHKVVKFAEKPDIYKAKRYIRDKNYLWNTGVFLFRASAILKALKALAPEVYRGAQAAADDPGLFRKLPDISIDYAVMEKADNVYCAVGKYQWKDIGSFEVLPEVLKLEGRRFVSRNGKIIKVI